MPIEIPGNIALDVREPVPGDSFNWEAVEPAAAKKSIVIHATASQAPGEDGMTVAEYHVNHNGWGGVGVHLVCTKDSYPGRAGFSDGGVQLHYVGDLSTWRAGTLNQNPGRIHIEISGLFTPGNDLPSEAQLRKVRAFIEWALAPNNVLPSLNYNSQVTYHNAVPDQNTDCPGWQHPQFNEWFTYLQGGAEPSWFAKPTPVATDPGQGGGTPVPVTVVSPEYEQTWSPLRDSSGNPTSVSREVLREGAVALNVLTGTPIENSRPNLTVGKSLEAWGYFTYQGHTYARTKYSVDNNLWNGVDVLFFEPPTGQPSGPVQVSTPPIATPAPNPILVGDVASNVTDAQLQEATVPITDKRSVLDIIKELIAEIAAKFIRRKKV